MAADLEYYSSTYETNDHHNAYSGTWKCNAF